MGSNVEHPMDQGAGSQGQGDRAPRRGPVLPEIGSGLVEEAGENAFLVSTLQFRYEVATERFREDIDHGAVETFRIAGAHQHAGTDDRSGGGAVSVERLDECGRIGVDYRPYGSEALQQFGCCNPAIASQEWAEEILQER